MPIAGLLAFLEASKTRDNIVLSRTYGAPQTMEAEDVRSSFLATTVHLQDDLDLSERD